MLLFGMCVYIYIYIYIYIYKETTYTRLLFFLIVESYIEYIESTIRKSIKAWSKACMCIYIYLQAPYALLLFETVHHLSTDSE